MAADGQPLARGILLINRFLFHVVPESCPGFEGQCTLAVQTLHFLTFFIFLQVESILEHIRALLQSPKSLTGLPQTCVLFFF